jgi:pyridoxamine 5'-phosphate oxidase
MEDLRLYINSLRHDFTKQTLDIKDVHPDPVLQFEKWFKEAVDSKVNEPNAMGISTVSTEGKPSSRIVLLRNFSNEGFIFYTNYDSKKGTDISKNPHAALLFFWPELERQVRIEGTLQKQSPEESTRYFNSRPRESKLGAWTSEQSKPISDRSVLDKAYEENAKKFPGNEVPRPEYWGGYVLIPDSFEFWQGRASRLHDRILYTSENKKWKIQRLSP